MNILNSIPLPLLNFLKAKIISIICQIRGQLLTEAIRYDIHYLDNSGKEEEVCHEKKMHRIDARINGRNPLYESAP